VRQGAGRLTNRIAERAGVNVASLYRYFPSKHAIIAELRRRHGAEQRAAVRSALIEHRSDDLETTLRALVSMGVAAHAVNPELQRVFCRRPAAAGLRGSRDDRCAAVCRISRVPDALDGGNRGSRAGDVDGRNSGRRCDPSRGRRATGGSVNRIDQ
jgi:AcrR family transcriptional regulator